MKLLHLGCHAILEYDELKILEELGVDYFALGSYIKPTEPVDPIRPVLNKIVDPHLLSIAPDRENMPQAFIDQFDVIMVMHVREWIQKNWPRMRHKPVIWRTIGQSTPEYEASLFNYRQDGLKIVRYSKREVMIEGNIGCDKVIPFYKDPEEFNNWNGMNAEVITFAQNMKERGEHCNYDFFNQVVAGFNAHVFGPKNEASGILNGGFLTYDNLRQKMRDSRVYVYTGTQPASYTLNFIEAMMTGIPIVAIGDRHATSLNIAGQTYEIPDIIHNGVNGFWSDDLETLRKYITFLLENPAAAKQIGQAGRETAIRIFGKETVKEQWKTFLSQFGTV